MERTARLHYVDALRVGAFGLLILYHASVAFFPDMDWLVHSADTSPLLQALMNHPRAWRLALLFFVSGMGVYFASRGCSLPRFVAGRFHRLAVPLLAAMAVFVVPQVWCERVMREGYDGSLARFWLTRYFTEGKYPEGNITWAQMWFVGYLIALVFTVVPLLKLLDRPSLDGLSRRFERAARTPWLYALFLLPLGLNLALSPLFPRQTNALYNDGAWFATWAAWFALGFLFARHHRWLVGGVIARRWKSAGLAGLLTGLLVVLSWGPHPSPSVGGYGEMQVPFKLLTFALAWAMILALVGFAARHVIRPNRVVSYLNDGVFAYYIIHQTIIVAALFLLLPQGLGLWATYGLVVAATTLGCLGFYEVGRRLPAGLALAFGIQKRPPAAAVPPIAAVPAEAAAEVETRRLAA